jgi:hypothetical protein
VGVSDAASPGQSVPLVVASRPSCVAPS